MAAPPARRAAILLNRASGSAGSSRVRRAVELSRDALGAEVLAIASRDVGQLEAWVRDASAGFDTVVVAGGDGTMSVAYNVLAGSDTVLGYVPAGVGNATAHLLRMPRAPGAIADVLAGGDARAIDLVRVEGEGVERLGLFAGVGWDAQVVDRYTGSTTRGLAGWASAIVRSLPDLVRRRAVSVVGDGVEVHRGPIELLVIGTTPWFGRGLLVNPGARPDAGHLSVRPYAGPVPRFALDALRMLARRPGQVGTNVTHLSVTTLDRRPLPLQVDGDSFGERDTWRFSVAPGAVRLIGRW